MRKVFSAHRVPASPGDIRARRQRLTRGIFAGMLVIGLVAAISPLLPLYNQLQSYAERLNLAYAESTASAVEFRLEAFQSVAEQFTSRSEIRQRLQLYAEGNLSFTELQAFTTPRLADAVSSTRQLQAAFRVLPDGRRLSELGTVSADFEPTSYLESGLWFFPHDESNIDHLKVVVAEPVTSPAGDTLAYDVLLFEPQALKQTIAANTQALEVGDIRACLVNPTNRVHISFTPELCDGDVIFEVISETAEQPGISTHRYADQSMVHYQIPLSNSDWQLLMRAPVYQTYQTVWGQVFIVVGIILVAMLVAAIVVRWALRPVLRDLSAQAERVETANEELLLADEVFNKSKEAMLITEPDLTMLRANPAFSTLLDIARAEVTGHSLYQVLAPESKSQQKVAEVTAALANQDVWQGEAWYQVNGSTFPALQTISAVRNQQDKVVKLIHIFNDISSERAAMTAAERAATHDELTDLPNRAGLMDALQQALQKARRNKQQLAVLFLDLDRFKPVNDQLGHQAGDRVLQDVAQRLREMTRPSDVVARLGGDEFVLVLPDVSGVEAVRVVAEKILDVINQPFQVAGTEVNIGVSVGIALYPEHGDRRTLLLESADQAMYVAKENGRNCYHFYGPD